MAMEKWINIEIMPMMIMSKMATGEYAMPRNAAIISMLRRHRDKPKKINPKKSHNSENSSRNFLRLMRKRTEAIKKRLPAIATY